MSYIYRKDSIPSSHSFPIGKSLLDHVLQEADIKKIHAIYYFRRTTGDIVLRADYIGEEQHNWAANGLSTITVYSVPSTDRRDIGEWLKTEVLPRLIKWLGTAEKAGSVWRNSRHSISFHYNSGATTITEE